MPVSSNERGVVHTRDQWEEGSLAAFNGAPRLCHSVAEGASAFTQTGIKGGESHNRVINSLAKMFHKISIIILSNRRRYLNICHCSTFSRCIQDVLFNA